MGDGPRRTSLEADKKKAQDVLKPPGMDFQEDGVRDKAGPSWRLLIPFSPVGEAANGSLLRSTLSLEVTHLCAQH